MELQHLGLLLLVAALLVAVVLWQRASSRVSRANASRQRVASSGEAEAEALVQSLGFSVVDRQVTQRWDLQVGDERVEVWCRADLLLRHAHGLFIGEVKTGGVAPDPRHPATRRQLLEYRLAFDVVGVLLIDVAQGVVQEIRFPGLLAEDE